MYALLKHQVQCRLFRSAKSSVCFTKKVAIVPQKFQLNFLWFEFKFRFEHKQYYVISEYFNAHLLVSDELNLMSYKLIFKSLALDGQAENLEKISILIHNNKLIFMRRV